MARKEETDTVEKVHCAHDKMVLLKSLVPNPKNPNHHPKKQIELLARIIGETGWRAPITVSNRSGMIVRGHCRFAAASELGAELVPVDYQDYDSDEAEIADLLADNRIAELAEWDVEALDGIIDGFDFDTMDIEMTGFTEKDLNDFIGGQDDQRDIDAEPKVDEAKQLCQKWGVLPGQIWALGPHRVMCGDSTDMDSVEKLFSTLSVDTRIIVTDPPYGVNYDASWRNAAMPAKNDPHRWKDGKGRPVGKVTNDDNAQWAEAFRVKSADVIYIWHADRNSVDAFTSVVDAGFLVKQQIILVKNQLVIGRSHYHYQHEPCLYAVRKGAKANWIGGRKQTTIWEIDKPRKSDTGHSTQKPVECMARPIRNHESDGVYDPFLGSGTTLIACEQLNRVCFGMEIYPGYVAVTLERYLDATGKKPEMVSGPTASPPKTVRKKKTGSSVKSGTKKGRSK